MIETSLAHFLMITAFIVGYLAIIFESKLHINKTASALITAVVCWSCLFLTEGHIPSLGLEALSEHLGNIAQIILFLLGAMTIVELIDSHRGFKIITDFIQTSSKIRMLWVIGIFSFFLSAVLDNLTTTIVIISLLRKLIPDRKERILLSSIVVIAANAGGAWTPIGDVTTTMLWINGNITSLKTIQALFFPSLISLFVALLCVGFQLKGSYPGLVQKAHEEAPEYGARRVFFVGFFSLIFVPIFKALTGLPPFMGVLIGLGVLWLITDILHAAEDSRAHLKVPHVLARIDISGVLFFLGILLCVSALDTAGILKTIANFLNNTIENLTIIATLIGIISAIIDNVPLVAAGMGMYDMTAYPVDSHFWQLLAYCAGTGGSILIIGSAAGVALMSLEKIDFMWYLKHIGWIAFLSYLSGIGAYLLQNLL
jgi:NhaD family Na+/H+ antiporter